MQTKIRRKSLFCAAAFLLVAGCASPGPTGYVTDTTSMQGQKLKFLGYTIQAGAFANVENAVRLTDALNAHELEAFYFRGEKGLYRVRFGDFSTREEAAEKAGILQSRNVLEDFYIVQPEEYPVFPEKKNNETVLREGIVSTAKGFLGIPYHWGGDSTEEGFDCSGLVMAVYRLNGLRLPRTSGEQYGDGLQVKLRRVKKGDLVFFAPERRKKVSHVGVYIGGGNFIHAPGRGSAVRVDSLSSDYYGERYVGARSYL